MNAAGVLLVLGGVVVLNHLRLNLLYGGRTRQCQIVLKEILAAEESFRQRTGRYTEKVRELGYKLEGANCYAYFLAESGPIEDRSQDLWRGTDDDTGFGVHSDECSHHGEVTFHEVSRTELPRALTGGVRPGVSSAGFVAACVSNFDDDPGVDVWSIATFARTAADGSLVPAGAPHHEASDQ